MRQSELKAERLSELATLDGDWLKWLEAAKRAKALYPIEAPHNRLTNSKTRQSKPKPEVSYEGLEGEWLDWLEVAKRYEVKVPSQDRGDIRHTIILELALARAKTLESIPLYRAYRIASYMIADYWRQQRKLNTGLDCRHCSKAQRAKCKQYDLYGQCPKLISLEYLETERFDSEGNRVTIEDTLADDKALDLDKWLDEVTFLRGCPTRLIELAYKRQAGIPLSDTDQRYYTRQRSKHFQRYQQSLLL